MVLSLPFLLTVSPSLCLINKLQIEEALDNKDIRSPFLKQVCSRWILLETGILATGCVLVMHVMQQPATSNAILTQLTFALAVMNVFMPRILSFCNTIVCWFALNVRMPQQLSPVRLMQHHSVSVVMLRYTLPTQ